MAGFAIQIEKYCRINKEKKKAGDAGKMDTRPQPPQTNLSILSLFVPFFT